MAPPPASLRGFAIEVIDKFNVLCSDLSNDDPQSAFYKSFKAELLLVQEWLEAQPQQLDSQIAARISKLLVNLERLSKWPPNLKKGGNIGSIPQRLAAKWKPPYPNLSKLLTNPNQAKLCLRHFATHEPQFQQQAFLRILKRLPKRNEVLPLEAVTAASTQPQDLEMVDYTSHARSLYGVLAQHSICSSASEPGHIVPHLRLAACRNPAGTHVTFPIFFLDHPHQPGSNGTCQWQGTRIDVFKKSVSFSDGPSRTSDDTSSYIVEAGSFCNIISNPQNAGVELSLSVADEKLVLRELRLQQSSFHLHMPSVSLSQLLEGRQLSRKMRLLLCYILSRTVWQFYESEWVSREWTKENIHFMFEHRNGVPSGIFVNEPFLSARFGREIDGDKDSPRVHKFPKILALGIILLEIELGVDITKDRPRTCFTADGQLTVNSDLIAADFWFQKKDLWKRQDSLVPVKAAVERCLRPSLFEPCRNDVEAEREVLHKQIVSPLHTLFKVSWGPPDNVDLDPVQVNADTSKSAADPRPSTKISASTGVVKSHLSDELFGFLQAQLARLDIQPSLTLTANSRIAGSAMTVKALGDSQTWFDELDKLNSVLRATRAKSQDYQAIRVAVLDTGITEALSDHIKQYKDFVDHDDETPHDLTGHGTNTARLILKMFNKADLFIARVLDSNKVETSEMGSAAQDLMASAIQHAIASWEVDIIVIPWGFETDHAGIMDQIKRACVARILVFAAASNYSNVRRVTFPGRMQHNVICMFATNATVKHSTFNPSRIAKRYNFAILGEEVSLHQDGDLLSGTSVATAIGAGLAARLLDFSRHPDCREWIHRPEDLKLIEGMSAVFAVMAGGGDDNGYNCIAPWRLLEDLAEGEPRDKKREYICQTISRALRDMNRT
ncbi:hypothetical protein B0H63DRAFT_186431 [Podospora didyma]|uniref:Peptidase S8/S53 domain-containing protein n=1 Tax=Podospora didyma TaxID=330526 RepID=A0AAE0NQL8_9PEZI|nr:hypothetical protein B0H63DRAFT_186431 [Podospora didyma]